MKRRLKEELIKKLFLLLSLSSILFLLGIAIVLFMQGLPILGVTSIGELLFGKLWFPAFEPPLFGLLPLIWATVLVTFGAMIIAAPLGVGAAIYISEIASPSIKELVKPVVELLHGVPSIIYGFFGLMIVAPWVKDIFGLPVGLTAFTASVLLGIMAIPIVTSLAEDAITSVPKSFKEASYALGANRMETIFKVTVPAAIGGISTAVILGMGRVIGETMVVLMVAGGATLLVISPFEPVRPMTATIAAEMGDTVVGSSHHHALFAIGAVLFIMTLTLYVVADYITHKFRRKY